MRRAPLLLLLLASLVFGLWVTGGVWADPTGRLVDTTFTDGHLVATVLGATEVRQGRLFQLHSDLAGWPDGLGFRPMLWPVILAAAAVGPVLALNLAWALTPVIGAAGGYALARVLGGGPAAAVLTGGLVAWSPWVRTTLRNGQVEQALLGLLAGFWAAALWSVGRGAGAKPVLLVPALLLLPLGLTTPHLSLTAALGLAVMAVVAVATAPRSRSTWVAWGVVLLTCLGSALLVDAYHSASFDEVSNLFHPRRGEHALQDLDASLWDYLWPRSAAAHDAPVVHEVFLGWVAVLAAVVAVARRRARTASSTALLLVLLVLSLGSEATIGGFTVPLPARLLYAAAPSLELSNTPYRMAAGVVVALAALAGVGLFGAEPATRRRWLGATLVVAASWAETSLDPGGPLPMATRPAWHVPELVGLRGGSGPVLDLPMCKQPCSHGAAYYLNAVGLHGRPLLHDMAPSPSYGANLEALEEINRYLRRGRCTRVILRRLQQLGVGAVVVHEWQSCEAASETRRCLTEVLGPPTVGGDVVWWDGLSEPADQPADR